MPRFAAADAVEALLYCGEAFVDQRLKLVVGEDVGPILLNPLPRPKDGSDRVVLIQPEQAAGVNALVP
jgi:hypothetical protein